MSRINRRTKFSAEKNLLYNFVKFTIATHWSDRKYVSGRQRGGSRNIVILLLYSYIRRVTE